MRSYDRVQRMNTQLMKLCQFFYNQKILDRLVAIANEFEMSCTDYDEI